MSKVAIVTGATRGIGKACALSLARQGFDVVVTGRTQKEGEGTATLPFSREGKQVPVPGSLETTVQAVQALGREALPVRMDVLDRGLMDIGNRVVFSREVELAAHVRKKTDGGRSRVLVRTVRIGSYAFIGAASRLCPGASVPSNASVPEMTNIGVNEVFGDAVRHHEQAEAEFV